MKVRPIIVPRRELICAGGRKNNCRTRSITRKHNAMIYIKTSTIIPPFLSSRTHFGDMNLNEYLAEANPSTKSRQLGMIRIAVPSITVHRK